MPQIKARNLLHDERTDVGPWAVFLIFLRLGLTSFGGPIAHLGYFRTEFVTERKWLTEEAYADLVALCQFLPGPASSQVGIALGFFRSGHIGALAAWAGFTLPSAVALILCALGMLAYGDLMPSGLLHGLKVVAVAVVAQALWGMARQLCPDAQRILIMAAAASVVLLMPSAWGQVAVILMAALVGILVLKPRPQMAQSHSLVTMRPPLGLFWLLLFFALLLGLPLLSVIFPGQSLSMLDAFYRAGALVFGGGHVVLPMLQAEVVPPGWVGDDAFLAGYGLAQAVPGPLFTFAAFLGASMNQAPSGWLGGLLCLLAIFAPSFLLVLGALPFWESLRPHARVQAALSGINAAVVGLLLAAFYQPVWMSGIQAPRDFALAILALGALMVWRLPPWLVVIGSAVMGWFLGLAF